MQVQVMPDGTYQPLPADPYRKLRGQIGAGGDFAVLVPLIVIETGVSREFWTTDGQMIGTTKAPLPK